VISCKRRCRVHSARRSCRTDAVCSKIDAVRVACATAAGCVCKRQYKFVSLLYFGRCVRRTLKSIKANWSIRSPCGLGYASLVLPGLELFLCLSSSLSQRPRKGEQYLHFRGGSLLSLTGICSDEAGPDEIVWWTVNLSFPVSIYEI
jgi:hypothetical protein